MWDGGVFTVGAFFDGRPGHEKQTRGILQQLGKKTALQTVEIYTPRRRNLQQVVDWLCFLSGHEEPDRRLASCDLLMGTGTPTHIPMLMQKRSLRIPAVTCMTPSPLFQGDFDIIFSPFHDNVKERDNIIHTIGPPNVNTNRGNHQEERVLVLIGGANPKKKDVWNSQEIVTNVEELANCHRDKRMIVSSSPRTPEQTTSSLAALAERYENVEFHAFKDTPAGWVEEEYGKCSQVWVTGDSISMVYEALSSGCHVGIIPVRQASGKAKFARSEKFLRDLGFTVDLRSYLQGKASWAASTSLNEAARCAEEILKRFT